MYHVGMQIQLGLGSVDVNCVQFW